MDLPCSHSRTEASKYCPVNSRVARVKGKTCQRTFETPIILLLTNTCHEKTKDKDRAGTKSRGINKGAAQTEASRTNVDPCWGDIPAYLYYPLKVLTATADNATTTPYFGM